MNTGYSYTDPNPFPQEIKRFFQENNKAGAADDLVKLGSLFDKNPSVRKAFVNWARDHQSLVEYTPRLYEALNLAAPNGEYQDLAKLVNTLYLKAFGDNTANVIQELLMSDPAPGDKLPDNFLKESLNLYEYGILDSKQLIHLIDCLQKTYNDHHGDSDYSVNRQFEKIPNLIHTDNLDILSNILSLRDSVNYGVLHYPESAEKLIPFLMTQEPNVLSQLFYVHVYHHQEHPAIPEKLFPVLHKLNPFLLYSVLTVRNISHMLNDAKPEKLWKFFFRADFIINFFNILSKRPDLIDTFFFKLKDFAGRTILEHPEYLKLFTEFLEKHSAKDLITTCQQLPPSLNRLIIPALYKKIIQTNPELRILETINLKPITFEEAVLFFLTPYSQKNTAKANQLLPILERLPSEQLIHLLSLQNIDGGSLLHYEDSLNLLLPTLMKLDPDQLYQIFAGTNFQGNTPLHYPTLFPLLTPLLKRLNDSQLISLLLIKDNADKTPLDKPGGLEQLLPLIVEKFDPQNCIEILSGKNQDGNPLLNTENFKLALPYLLNSNTENLNSLFSAQYLHGDTLLHNPQIYELAKPLFSKLNPKVFEIKNNDGMSVKDTPSMKWLTNEKEGVNTKPLSEDEYKTKATELKTAIDALWESFVFGNEEGEVPAEYLKFGEIKHATGEIIHQPEDLDGTRKLLKQNLDLMIGKIVERRAWLGTPQENQQEALLEFYSPMLLNFERIIELWESENIPPAAKAGTLIDLSKIEISGRCAAAYQSEIGQAKMILESNKKTQSKAEKSSMDLVFSQIAQTCLVKCIETVVQQKHRGDSHDYSQFLYSVGLQAAPDPLAKLAVEACHHEIIDQWTTTKIVTDFLAGFKKVDFDTALYWFQQVTPDEFGQELLANLPKTEALEQQYLIEAGEHIGNLTAAKIFQSAEGAALKPLAQLPARKFVSEKTYNQLSEATSLNDIEAIEGLQRQDIESDTNRRRELVDVIADLRKTPAESRNETQEKMLQAATTEQRELQQKSIGVASEFNRMKTGTIHKLKLKALLEKSGVPLSSINLSTVIEAKKTYDEKISDLADHLDINFNPEQGSLSNAVKYNRKLEFAKQFFTDNKLNAGGAVFILSRIGVLEQQK